MDKLLLLWAKASSPTCSCAFSRSHCSLSLPSHLHCQTLPVSLQSPSFKNLSFDVPCFQWLHDISSFYSWASWRSSPYAQALLAPITSLLYLSQPRLPSTHSTEKAPIRVTEELPGSKLSVTLFFLNFQYYLSEWTILSFLKHLVHVACNRPHSLNLLSLLPGS